MKAYVKWQPVTERNMMYIGKLPRDGQDVLVSSKWGVDSTTFYCGIFDGYEEGEVFAWADMPEPYQRE